MCLPTFFIVGTAKAGTTSLWHYLAQHPDIYMSPVKEPHYFAFPDGVPSYEGPGDESRLDMVVSDFEAYRHLFEGASAYKARGEASAMYLYLKNSAKNIAACLPEARLIALLRNPVDRAFSAYLHHRRDGLETLTFEEALEAEALGLRENWSPLWHYWQMGQYAEQIINLYQYVDRDRVLILLYESFAKKPMATVERIFRFIGVDPDFAPDMQTRHNVGGIPRLRWLHRFLVHRTPVKRMIRKVIPSFLFEPVYRKIRRLNMGPSPFLPSRVRRRLMNKCQSELESLERLLNSDLDIWRPRTDP